MRKMFFVCAAMILMAACSNKAEAKTVNRDNLYIMETRVIDFEEASDLVVAETETGNLYTFYGIEDWQLNDRCVLLMDDMGTENIEDDEIIRTFYRR